MVDRGVGTSTFWVSNELWDRFARAWPVWLRRRGEKSYLGLKRFLGKEEAMRVVCREVESWKR